MLFPARYQSIEEESVRASVMLRDAQNICLFKNKLKNPKKNSCKIKRSVQKYSRSVGYMTMSIC